jgi:soluble lytic murein transglycosylase
MNRTFDLFCLGTAWLVLACGTTADSRAEPNAGREVDLAHVASAAVLQGDPLAQRADSLVRAGRPWRATALLAPRLTSPSSASPELLLAGARAAAGWDGWTEVERLLRNAAWLDTQFGGDGRELLARSALERGADALGDARLALHDAANDASRVSRSVLLARAFDRANVRDSAAALYLSAAARLPRVSDWLRLRAAGVTADSAERAALFARVASAAARARIVSTDAQARERSGDLAGAARQFRRAGSETSALRVESLAARDSETRVALSQRIVAFLSRTPNSADTRQSLDLLDKLPALSARDELIVARAAAVAGVSARAITGFGRAAAATPLSAGDRMSFAGALARAGRNAEAAKMYASVSDDPKLAPVAAYQQARAILQSGDGASARAALRSVSTSYAADRAAAAPALLLLADLQVDDGALTGAAQSLAELVKRYPGASQAPLARLRVGLLQWADHPALAAATFDSLAALHPSDDEAIAGRYWAGRAYERLDQTREATSRWQAIIRTSPLSYYALLAAERLHASAWKAPAGADSAAHLAPVDSAVNRITTLQKLGMDVEARFEIDALADRADRAPASAPAVAEALGTVGDPARALRIALAAIARGDSSRALFRVAYPVVHSDALVEESKRNGLDPALVAGLIRQESSWNPHAVSPASARGLMQLLPSVGASIAASRSYPLWNPALLFDPDVSIELGTAHLASSLRGDSPPARALAAYNAGASRVTRWAQRPGADDAQLFTEWIPFVETRDYVRIVQRNAEVYRALYGLR